MEHSTVERAAVAAVAAHTVPLKALVEALAALERVANLETNPLISLGLFMQVTGARNVLRYHVGKLLAAQQVGVSS